MFKNLKLQEKYTMFLKEMFSAVEVDSRSGKYIVLKTNEKGTDRFWFLGKAGAVRIARTNAATKSMDFARHIQDTFGAWEVIKLEKEENK